MVSFAGVHFYYKEDQISYYLHIHQSPKDGDPEADALIELARRLEKKDNTLWKRMSIRNPESKHVSLRFPAPRDHYENVADMLADFRKDVFPFLATIDAEITKLRQEDKALNIQRLPPEYFDQVRSRIDWRYKQYGRSWPVFEQFNRNYWPVASTYDDLEVADEMIKQNVVSVGSCRELNLSEYVGAANKNIITYLRELGRKESEWKVLKRFLNFKTGDKIGLKRGNKVLAIGTVTSEEYRYEPDGLAHTFPVDWTPLQQEKELPTMYRGTLFSITDQDYIEIIFGDNPSVDVPFIMADTVMKNAPTTLKQAGYDSIHPLNQILYGPPGTGKTYATIAKAVELLDPDFNDGGIRAKLKARYQELRNEGRVVFTTFHQSLAYEDFVEGIKPVVPEEGDMTYETLDGIFKNLCIDSAFSFVRNNNSEETERVLDFSAQFDDFVTHLQRELENKEYVQLKTISGRNVQVININDRGNIVIKPEKGTREVVISKNRQSRLNSEIQNLHNLDNIYTSFAKVIGGSNATIQWAVLNAIRQSNATTREKDKRNISQLEKKEVVRTLKSTDYQKEAPNYVLIIDEINRGNVSRIFGELITLLEPDKRLGQAEELTVTLPYSRETFGVPPNLYLIGTMNTADRSVVALDSALRRRFRFVEVPPDSEVIRKNLIGAIRVGDLDLDCARLMEVINERVEFLLDHDHCIGHSYFLKMKTAKDVAEQFATGIVPLLREYFYEDYRQLRLVLGDGFVKQYSRLSSASFPLGANIGDYEVGDYIRYEIIDYREKITELGRALRILLNQVEPDQKEA